MRSTYFQVKRILLTNTCSPVAIIWSSKHLKYSSFISSYNKNFSFCQPVNMTQQLGLSMNDVLEKLKKIAPLTLAESWDNVGLLVEPSSPKNIKKILVTNDLTERVLDEALSFQTDFIISYHPPIFAPLKCLTSRSWKERIIVKCIENRIAVFSPHTSYDSVQGGVTDWMASVFGNECTVDPLTPAKTEGVYSHSVEVVFPKSPAGNSAMDAFQRNLRRFVGTCGEEPTCNLIDISTSGMKINVPCTSNSVSEVTKMFHEVKTGSEEEFLRITRHEKVSLPYCGSGRMCKLKEPLTVSKIVEKVKLHIKRPHVRVALVPGKDMDSIVSTIAICVGSGTSVLRGVKADLYLTGEMLHHDVLDAVHNGSHVILCNHSDSERGFLHTLALKLSSEFQDAVEVKISKEDKDPLFVV